MRITARDLRHLVRLIHEAEEGEHMPFKPGSVMELVRPVRVTPVAHGDWADMDTRGVLGYEGGEDSPGSRRASRPRGITATILKPGTRCRITRAGKNEAVCTPIGDGGQPIVDDKTGNPLSNVKVHINKFCPHCAGTYAAGKGAAKAAMSNEERAAQIRARIAKQQAELAALEGGEGDPWAEKTDPDAQA